MMSGRKHIYISEQILRSIKHLKKFHFALDMKDSSDDFETREGWVSNKMLILVHTPPNIMPPNKWPTY